ncbi:MAG: glycoside hydrolase family 5 protein [Pseudomonadota bacterium]
MSFKNSILLAVALSSSACTSAEADQRPHRSAYGYALAPAATPRAGISLPLGKCVNLGGMLEFVPEARGAGRPLRDADLKIIKAAGFSTVRVPIAFAAYASPKPPYTIDPQFMARVQHVVDTGLANGLNVIIDVHHFVALMEDPYGQSARFTAIWKQIADTFQDAPKGLWFELLNEPTGQFWNKVSVWTVYRPALAAIRRTNPTRPVVIAGNLGGKIDSLIGLQMPDDPYLVPTVHNYDPKAFTHQGAAWTIERFSRGRPLLDSDQKVIDARVQAVKAYMDRTGRVPFLGEFGVIDDPAISTADRVKYYGMVTAAYASIGVQSCGWSFTNGFDMYKNGAWVPGLLDALQTSTTRSAR